MDLQQEREHLKRWSQGDICRYLATKVRRVRRDLDDSQAEFAKKAGVPLRTYKRFETHGKANLETFIQVLQAVGRAEYLFMLFPMEQLPQVKPSLDERLRQLTPTKFR